MLRASELGDVGLGHRERRADLAVEQRAQPAVLLLLRAELREHLHVARCRARRSCTASGAMWLRPVISASGAYSTLVSPGPYSGSGWNRFHSPRAARLRLELLHHRRMGVRVAAPRAAARS